MTTTSRPLEHTEEGRAFLQARTARFGLWGFALGAFFVAVRLIQAACAQCLLRDLDLSMLLHVLAALSLLGIWATCRSGIRSVRFLRTTETLGLLLACSFYALMGLHLPIVAQPHFVVLLALGFGIIARSIYVPSSRRRTVWLTSLCGIPLLLATYLMYYDMDIEPWLEIAPELGRLGSRGLAWATVGFALAWWVCVVAICAGASSVIYGLRKEVHHAMKLGQYTLEEKICEGAMCTVYRARHAMLRRPTAIKLLPAEKTGAQHLARFEREVQLTAMLTHPNTVTIFDYGRTPEGVFYYAMELLDGATLRDVIEIDGAQPAARVAYILAGVAGSLAEAHGVGLMHRDIKPANIMLAEQGGKPDVAKVLDFGLVKELGGSAEVDLTQDGSVTGTPQYLAPESIEHPDEVDQRADIYALGAVGYFLLTGEHVFTGETVIEICVKHLRNEPPPLSERLGKPVPAALEALVLRCLSKDAADRPQTALELQAALHDLQGLGTWNEADARSWWQRYRPVLAARSKTKPLSGSDQTMAVDLEDRSAMGSTSA